jgi:Asp-tRNA(Asn)/Glu-tRNA(Gln) amidotransferase A subunit family amidase
MKKRSVLWILPGVLFLVSMGLNIYFVAGRRGIHSQTLAAAEEIIGLDFTSKERKLMLKDVHENREAFEEIRAIPMDNSIPPAVIFNPEVPGFRHVDGKDGFAVSKTGKFMAPENLEDAAFYTIQELAYFIKTHQITSTDLTKMYLARLKRYGPQLECVITLMEEAALYQAEQADKEIAAGKYRGPLHGIPWGAKDLLATAGNKTTWGAMPYKDQVIDEDATVVKKLREAGAVLVAKLTMGALAWGDVWFGGKTRNPWNIEEGSSGSSAGSAAAVSAGLVAFAIGTETWGSIISPSTQCRVTGLRPTFGRVSRHGAMALSWSMDKIGPICRSVEDCAIVFHAIYGPDGKDLTVTDLPFRWDPSLPLNSIRIGYLMKVFEEDTANTGKNEEILKTLRNRGADLIPFELPDFPVSPMAFILNAEAAAAFDELTRSNRDDLLVRQERYAWPNVFRQARFIPAVEYIQANRTRTLLMRAMAEKMKNIDVFVAPSYGGETLLLTNLTGHPAVVVPAGVNVQGRSTSITFIGNLFEEGKTLAVAKAFQDATTYHLEHPDIQGLEGKKTNE